MAEGLADRIVELNGLIDTGLRTIAGAAEGEESADAETRNRGARSILRRDVESHTAGLHDFLGSAGVEVQADVVGGDIVDQRGAELMHIVKGIEVRVRQAAIAESRNGSSGERDIVRNR